MEQNSFPQPPPFTWKRHHVRDVLPIYPPTELLEDLPVLPSPPRKPAFDAPFTLTTHLFPATFLRTSRLLPLPKSPPAGVTKEERRQIATESALQLYRWSNDAKAATANGHPLVLWNCVNRYVKKNLDSSNRTGVTLFLAHANGFPKEIWEPAIGHLLSLPAARVIDEIWAWESVHHGDAGLINAAKTSAVSDWIDGGRDVANFLLYFLPSIAIDTVLPVHLQKVSAEETSLRVQRGFEDRKFVAVGHSYGGCICSLAASLYPKLFHSLVLIDPVIHQNPLNTGMGGIKMFLQNALNRRNTWSSRQEAYNLFQKNPFFQAWDPAVLQVYLECAIYLTKDEDGKEIAKLKMPSIVEGVVFAHVVTSYEVYERLVDLDERIAIRWLMPGKPGAPELQPGKTEQRVWVRPNNSTNIKILGGGHLIPQEAPQELAVDLDKFILHHFPMTGSSFKARL